MKLGKGVEVGDDSSMVPAVISTSTPTKVKCGYLSTQLYKGMVRYRFASCYQNPTHCGYKVEADSIERRRMLNARRELFKSEMKIVESDKDAHVQSR